MNIHHLVHCSQLKTGLLEIACLLDDDEQYTRPMAVRDLKKLIEQAVLLESACQGERCPVCHRMHECGH
ncbi:exonuclease [Paenibacillus dendritiformis]|uniref:Uncharacterized protein n=1 Tax=Paenibacillus dendritiformis C454 TaxID=1131935 RepID=H3SA90_9BACL|nr:hypothetical protein [Paenibacillus dendritiformis]EHQ64114.1 hypothetical protein PDENDC454_02115 [Paenibacillus dendritiformis C454]PZM66584.1 exonuclease [Paenibacillus dendritiformis]TDL57047.1 exonuclease [Paenibacillus dendritiformis]CAH8771842.1 exonuclease [Paenibacillus dendritiformis]